MKYSLIIYVCAVLVGVGWLAHAMTTDEVTNIWYLAPKKTMFRNLDHGLVPKVYTVIPTTSILVSSGKIHQSPVVTVDVRQALEEQIDDVWGVYDSDIIVPEEETITGSYQTWTSYTWVQSDIVYINNWQYVDVSQVRDTWLQWTNYLRTEQLGDRKAYVTDWRLNATATAWSQYAASIGSISHKRKSSDSYYNYNWLVQWFKDKGKELTGSPIVFKNISRATFSESIWRWMYSCSEADCTDEVIEATRSTWNFFYKERAANGVHYRALTHKNFGTQWLGIAFSGKKYFLTIHYGTQIIE